MTFMPPVTRTRVSRPDRSVTCTNVSLNDAKMCATPKSVSPSVSLGPRVVTSLTTSAFLDMVAKCAVRELGDGTEAPLPTQPTCAIVAATCYLLAQLEAAR